MARAPGRNATRPWPPADAACWSRANERRPGRGREARAADLHGQPDREVLRGPEGRRGRRGGPSEVLLGSADACRDHRLATGRRGRPRPTRRRGRGSPQPVKPSDVLPAARWRGGASEPFSREVPEETPVALVHDATTTAVMMATPADLEDFGIGFSLTERIVARRDEITAVECVAEGSGIEIRMWLAGEPSAALA